MNLELVDLDLPPETNIIVGHSHFIKTVEDLYEVMVGTVPGIEFGLAFCEASGDCLIRTEGNSDELIQASVNNARAVGAGHSFFILMKNAYPINVLNGVKSCQEVCRIFCATANPVQVVVTRTDQGAAILGVVDGESPRGVENAEHQAKRKQLLQAIGYKR
ncbi:MAG: adenosine-specific kinase [Desulfatibacillaceae bacterium]